jgi:hypothetical protein
VDYNANNAYLSLSFHDGLLLAALVLNRIVHVLQTPFPDQAMYRERKLFIGPHAIQHMDQIRIIWPTNEKDEIVAVCRCANYLRKDGGCHDSPQAPIVLSVHPSDLPDWKVAQVSDEVEVLSKKKSKMTEDFSASSKSTSLRKGGDADGAVGVTAKSSALKPTSIGSAYVIPGAWPDDVDAAGEIVTLGEFALSVYRVWGQMCCWCVFFVIICRQLVSRQRAGK